MQLKIKLLTGKIMMSNFEEDQKIKELKEAISEREGIHSDQIKLLYSGKILDNETTVKEAKLSPNSLISMVLNLRGG